MKHGNRTPAGGPATALVPFDLWGSRAWCNQEVVGESHHLPDLQRLFGRISGRERELECAAFLVPEPGNRFDPAAVAVHIEGRIVGHLPREIAGDYRQCLSELTARGLAARVNARVWGGLETDYETNRAGRLVRRSGSLQASRSRLRSLISVRRSTPNPWSRTCCCRMVALFRSGTGLATTAGGLGTTVRVDA